MSPQQQPPPIIIVRKKKGHGGHHGGAWKVAYADFVTAMMALFIVLWLLSSDEKVKKAVGGYFQDPSGNGNMMGTNLAGAGPSLSVSQSDMSEVKKAIQNALAEMPNFDKMKDQVDIVMTAEGLRIELLETQGGMFFESGRGEPTGNGRELLVLLARELGGLPNKLLIEGHTDAKPYADGGNYTNWELSADRANAARRLMQSSGVRPDQVSQVRGFADQRLRTPKEPENAANRRISVLVQYTEVPPGKAATVAAKDAPGAGGHAPAASGHGSPNAHAPAGGHGTPAAAGHAPAKPAGGH
ncbi:MAG: flagellar motor protein MotB [Bryobacteraceae bacterium]|nr:flagellar motor protein MotB [Bryobacteraceae bacterium]